MANVSDHTDQQNLTAASAFRGPAFTNPMDAGSLTREHITDHDRKRQDRETSRPSVGDRKLSLV